MIDGYVICIYPFYEKSKMKRFEIGNLWKYLEVCQQLRKIENQRGDTNNCRQAIRR